MKNEGSIEFDELIPYRKREIVLPKYPLECLPDTIQKMVRGVANNTETSEEMGASIVLGILAACIQGKYEIEGKKHHVEPLSIYSLVVADPAERKSPVFEKMAAPLKKYQSDLNQKLEPEIKQQELEIANMQRRINFLTAENERKHSKEREIEISRLSKELADIKKIKKVRLFAEDCTNEALDNLVAENGGRMNVISSEGGIFDVITGRYNHGNPNIDTWLKGHDGGSLTVDRVSREPIFVEHVFLSCVVTVQPVVVENVMTNEVLHRRGFLARILYSFPESFVGKRCYFTEEFPEEDIAEYEALIFRLCEFEPESAVRLFFDKECEDTIRNFNLKIEKLILNDGFYMKDWLGKYWGTVMRIAGILHVASEAKGAITKDELDRAIAIGEYYREHAAHLQMRFLMMLRVS